MTHTYVLPDGSKRVYRKRPGTQLPPKCRWWCVVDGLLAGTNHKLWRRARGHPFVWAEAARLLKVDPVIHES